ncbi:hypothetical protein ACHAW6_003992 [Cyclotella cf. meneghiniana]
MRRGQIIAAIRTIIHSIMSKTVTKDHYVNHASAIADLLLDRFNPKSLLSGMELEDMYTGLRAVINNEVEASAQELLLKMIGGQLKELCFSRLTPMNHFSCTYIIYIILCQPVTARYY